MNLFQAPYARKRDEYEHGRVEKVHEVQRFTADEGAASGCRELNVGFPKHDILAEFG
jgi:hypothetical protein